MKTNSNNQHNAVSSSPLPILLVLLVIVLVFAGNLSAGQNSTDVKNEPVPELRASAEGTEGSHQDTEAGQYERYYRTLISDPVDDREKLVELVDPYQYVFFITPLAQDIHRSQNWGLENPAQN